MSEAMNTSPGGCGQASPKLPRLSPAHGRSCGGSNRSAVANRMPSVSITMPRSYGASPTSGDAEAGCGHPGALLPLGDLGNDAPELTEDLRDFLARRMPTLHVSFHVVWIGTSQ